MGKTAVPKIQLDLTAEEIKAVVSLTEDQLFRVKFIDPEGTVLPTSADRLHGRPHVMGVVQQRRIQPWQQRRQ